MPTQTKKEKKIRRWNDLQDAVCSYSKILFVDADNVTSKQICELRKSLRAIDAKMVMGKNTLMRKSLLQLQTKPEPTDFDYAERMEYWADRPHISIIKDQVKLNTGMIFTNGDQYEIKDILDSNTREAQAKIGQIAPEDVIVPAGPTGMEPKHTSFFQTLDTATKIQKGQIEITNPVTVVKKGTKITQSQTALLDKLKIRPFEYKMNITNFLDGGKLIDAKVLYISTESILEKFKAKSQNLTALSLGAGYITPAAAQHLIARAFKNLAAASLASGFEIPQITAMKTAATSAPAIVVKVDAPVDVKPADCNCGENDEIDFEGGLFPMEDDDY